MKFGKRETHSARAPPQGKSEDPLKCNSKGGREEHGGEKVSNEFEKNDKVPITKMGGVNSLLGGKSRN